DDNHSGLKALGYPKLHICSYDLPSSPPAACTMLPLPCPMGTTVADCCPPNGWKLAAGIPADDCDDRAPSTFPNAPELCNGGIDDNCKGRGDEGCTCTRGASLTCSETSRGQTIVWPAPVPVGSCQ